MLGGEPVVHRDDRDAGGRCDVAAYRVVALEVSGDPAAAVEVGGRRQAGGQIGPVDVRTGTGPVTVSILRSWTSASSVRGPVSEMAAAIAALFCSGLIVSSGGGSPSISRNFWACGSSGIRGSPISALRTAVWGF
jgi:hypothetical protein